MVRRLTNHLPTARIVVEGLKNEMNITVKPHKILRRKNEEQKITFCEKFCREMPNGNRNTEMKKIIR